jgi:hypothetical protein
LFRIFRKIREDQSSFTMKEITLLPKQKNKRQSHHIPIHSLVRIASQQILLPLLKDLIEGLAKVLEFEERHRVAARGPDLVHIHDDNGARGGDGLDEILGNEGGVLGRFAFEDFPWDGS